MKGGFTLIELIVATTIVLLIVGTGVVTFNNFGATQKLRQAALDFKSNLRLAQTQAQAGQKPESCDTLIGYRVTFTDNSYAIQAKCQNGPQGEALNFSLPSDLTFVPIPAEFTFLGLTHGVVLSKNNSVFLSLTNSTQTYQLRLNTNGEIDDLGIVNGVQ